MNKSVLEYLSSLNKQEIKDFELPNTRGLTSIDLGQKENMNLSELPQSNIITNSIDRNIEFSPVGNPPEWLKKAVKERDGYKCVRCGLEQNKQIGIYLHIDHAVPRIKGGQNIIENLQTMCYDCNVIWKGEDIWFGPTLTKKELLLGET